MVFYDVVADFRTSMKDTRTLFTSSFAAQINGQTATSLFTFEQPWPNIDVTLTRLICDTFLRENGITQADRLSMASSIEMRLPLLDHRLVETIIGLRKTNTDSQQPPKAWLKAAIRDLLPSDVVDRPKRGFNPPVMDWHRALFAAHGRMLADGYLRQHDVLTPEAARQLSLGPFPDNSTTPLSFKALVLEHWCQRMTS
jgi:asparagine synthase (glutamine-hydrolysing)